MPPPPPPLPLRFAMNGNNNGNMRGSFAAPVGAAPRFQESEMTSSAALNANKRSPLSENSAGRQQPTEAPPPPLTHVSDRNGDAVSFPPACSAASPKAESSSSSSQRVEQLWQLVQDLTSENAILQQRVRILMEGEAHADPLPGLLADFSSPEAVEALVLRIRRLEAALKLEAMEREALEVRLQAQEQVLTRLMKR